LKKNNQLNLFLNKKYNDDVINNIELNWCKDAVKILAPDITVRIPNTICNKIIKPKIITDLNK
tara:strand:+ start:561 stop:749 length:189 start_codon:yes stop_codon:yes gene_type:complete